MEKYPKAKFVIITILTITLVNLIAMFFIIRFSFQDHHEEMDGRKKDYAARGFEFMKCKLNLNPQQEKTFKRERDTFFVKLNLIFDSLEMKRMEMVQTLSKPDPDREKLYHISDEMGRMHGTMKREVVDHMLTIRGMCNPDQIVRLDSMYKILIRNESPWRNKNQEEHTDKDQRK